MILSTAAAIGVRAIFLRGGTEQTHLCWKNISTAPEKNDIIHLEFRSKLHALPDSPRPVICKKNPDFGHFHLAGRNEFYFFRLINGRKKTFIVFLLAAVFCRKNLPAARKIVFCSTQGATTPLTRPCLARMYVCGGCCCYVDVSL